MSQKKTLFLPIETSIRELDYNLILAVMVLNPEVQVLIGQTGVICEEASQRLNGVILGKNFINNDKKRPMTMYKDFQKNGIRLFYLHEEGGPIFNFQSFQDRLNRYIDPNCFSGNDFVLTWGDLDREHYLEQIDSGLCNIVKVGTPRFDLGKKKYSALYQQEVEELKKQYGKIILFNTNFESNNYLGKGRVIINNAVASSDREMINQYIGQITHENDVYSNFIRLINELSQRYPDYSIVLRPHPSEEDSAYSSILEHIPNAHVTREGSLVSWFRASDCLIAHYCTTMMEAYLTGTPVINFKPVHDLRYQIPEMDAISKTCVNNEEVFEFIDDLKSSKYPSIMDLELMKKLRGRIANYEEGFDSFQVLCDLLSKSLAECDYTIEIPHKKPVREKLGSLKQNIKNTIKDCLINRLNVSSEKNAGYKHSMQKLFGFNPEAIDQKLRVMEQIFDKKVQTKWIHDRLVSITLVDS